jgi:hypothetical protein
MQQKMTAGPNLSLILKALLLVALVSGSSLARAAEGDGSPIRRDGTRLAAPDSRHHGYVAQPGWFRR